MKRKIVVYAGALGVALCDGYYDCDGGHIVLMIASPSCNSEKYPCGSAHLGLWLGAVSQDDSNRFLAMLNIVCVFDH
jgi:hypothetical protein